MLISDGHMMTIRMVIGSYHINTTSISVTHRATLRKITANSDYT